MTKSTITREQLEEWVAQFDEDGGCDATDRQLEALIRQSLAAMDSEPVAWTWHYREQWHVTNDKCRAEFVATDGDVAVVPLYRHAQPAQEYPEVLPCPVLLEPGMRFGKGVKTSTMLAALARRAVYESDMAALSPEERAEFQAGIEGFKALIAQPAPVVPVTDAMAYAFHHALTDSPLGDDDVEDIKAGLRAALVNVFNTQPPPQEVHDEK
ncbi:TPA: hypothetical protein MEF26_001459 [Klebsiella pneumoniae]|nr:hypothetical protein [Klebsiella pneumoniae]